MKKIIFYISNLGRGGAERVLLNLVISFNNKGYKVILVTDTVVLEEYNLPMEIERIVLEVEKSNRLQENLKKISKLRQIIKLERADYLVSFLAEPSFRASLATLGTQCKIILSVRNDPNREFPNYLYRALFRLLYERAEYVVFQTEEAWKKTKLSNGIIIPNSVSNEFYNTKRNKVTKYKNIVTIGRLDMQKNHKLLIDAFDKLKDRHPKENLLIYGDGDLKDELQLYIDEKKLNNRVFLKGRTNNVTDILENCKLFVLSSDYEGLPNALMEAMTVGVPVISTNCPSGGPAALINNNSNGLLVEVNNKDDLSNKMSFLLSNVSERTRLSKAARLSMQPYTEEEIFSKWEKLVN